MNKFDVIVFGLVAAMVIGVATAVTARYPGANVGSIADWCAAVGTIFAASTALYIAHHEARRAREVLLEDRAEAAAREKRAMEDRSDDRRRADAIMVQTAIGALTDGLRACKSFKSMMGTADPQQIRTSAKVAVATSKFTDPSRVMDALVPSAAYSSATAAYLIEAKSGWGISTTRVTIVGNNDLTKDVVDSLMNFDDVRGILRKGMVLHWQLINNVTEQPTTQVSAKIDAVLTDATW